MLNPFAHKKILKKGTPAKARIQSMSTPERGAAKQNIAMTLVVQIEGQTPYEVEDQWLVSSKDTLGFNLELPIKVDPKDQHRVAIDWPAAREMRSKEKSARQDRYQQMGDGSTLGTTPVANVADHQVIDTRNNPELREQILNSLKGAGVDVDAITSQSPGSDPLDRLERLAQLRDSGAITSAEYDEQKAKLLKEM